VCDLPSKQIFQCLMTSRPIRQACDGSRLNFAATIPITSIRGRSDSGKDKEQQCSSPILRPPIVRRGTLGLVSLSLRFVACTLLMIVKGEPVSINAIIGTGVGYSNPIARPASISDSGGITTTRIMGPGSLGSNGFQESLSGMFTRQSIPAPYPKSALLRKYL